MTVMRREPFESLVRRVLRFNYVFVNLALVLILVVVSWCIGIGPPRDWATVIRHFLALGLLFCALPVLLLAGLGGWLCMRELKGRSQPPSWRKDNEP
jgi:hypothetical protein